MLLALTLLLIVLVPLALTIFLILIFMRLASEPIVVDEEWWRKTPPRRRFGEPFRWVSPRDGFIRAAAPRPLDEARVYKELVNYVNRMYHEGRISLETRDKVIGELVERVRRLEGGQGEDSRASS
ncbi:MAG: hypothetical protein KIH01_08365 [Candidatus Freyarchaeota archaeon]|nr:hypothetical protein [Candidatus Jordarchaeia archaeon]